MQNKLDPRQYNPYSLNTPSGNLSFVQGVDFFNCYLLENLTGNFNYTGSLKINDANVVTIPTSNVYGGTNVSIFNSINAFATGTSNSIVASDLSEVSGQNNAIFGGANNQISDAINSSLFGGRNVVLKHTGATILGDGDNNRQKNSVEHYSLTIDFNSGSFFKNPVHIDGSLFVTGGNLVTQDFYVPSPSSGLLSGNLQVLGTAYHTGSPLQNLQNLRDASGTLTHLTTGASGSLRSLITGLSGSFDTKISTTGNTILSIGVTTSGHLKSDYDAQVNFCVKTTGSQTVNGTKHFTENNFFESITGRHIISTGTFVLGSGRAVPGAFNSIGRSGQISWGNGYLYICTGNNAWGRIAIGNF